MSIVPPGESAAVLIHHLRMLEIDAQHHLALYRAHVAGKEQRRAAADPAATQTAELPAAAGRDPERPPTGTETTLQVVQDSHNSLALAVAASGDGKSL